MSIVRGELHFKVDRLEEIEINASSLPFNQNRRQYEQHECHDSTIDIHL
jgi:hypothetical protein